MATYVTDPTPFLHTVYTVITNISGVSYYLSATVNPILYQLMSLKFQQAFKDTFGPFSTCLRGDPHSIEIGPLTQTGYTRGSSRTQKSFCGSANHIVTLK
ncbi:Neuromedin-U receptor 2, partial [Stegodyphus mimosarum]